MKKIFRGTMSVVSCILLLGGIFLIITTAGASDCRDISFTVAVARSFAGLASFVFGILGYSILHIARKNLTK